MSAGDLPVSSFSVRHSSIAPLTNPESAKVDTGGRAGLDGVGEGRCMTGGEEGTSCGVEAVSLFSGEVNNPSKPSLPKGEM